jgi:uridine kinase
MEMLPYRPKTVQSPTGSKAEGKELNVSVRWLFMSSIDRIDSLVGRLRRVYPAFVSLCVLRYSKIKLCSGGPLERGLRRVIRDVALGSLLIQTDPKSGEPMLLHAMLPRCIKLRHLAETSWVYLLDAQVGGIRYRCY